jgi:2-hydroxychromene-2-carboxylate isomerase
MERSDDLVGRRLHHGNPRDARRSAQTCANTLRNDVQTLARSHQVRQVDFYYDFSSTNSYFAVFMLPEIAARTGAAIRWLPIHSAGLFRGTGFDVMAMTARKARYLWRDHARYAEMTGLPFRKPSRFPIKTALALRCVLAAKRLTGDPRRAEAAAESLTKAVFRGYWERDEDIADAAVLRTLIPEAPEQALELAGRSEIRDELRALTDEAAARGVFGVPSFFVGEEMFWGKDRLDFVERRLLR